MLSQTQIVYSNVKSMLMASLSQIYIIFSAKYDSKLNIDLLKKKSRKISYWLLVDKLSPENLKWILKINNTIIECVHEINYLDIIII